MKSYLLFIIFSLVSFSVFSYPTDSLKKCLKETNDPFRKMAINAEIGTSFYRLGFIDSALHYNFIAGKLAENKGGKYPYGEESVFITRVLFYFRNQEFDAATAEAHKLFRDTASYSSLHKRVLCEYYSEILILEEKPEEALKVLHRALDIGKKAGVELGYLYLKIGIVFYNISNNNKAREYYNLSLNYKDVNPLAVKYNIVGTYMVEKRYDEALELLQTIVSESDSIVQGNYRLFNALGQLYLHNKNFDKSIKILLETNEFIQQHSKDVYSLMDNYNTISKAYIGKFKMTKNKVFLKESRYYLEKCLADAKKTENLQSQLECYSVLTEILIYQKEDVASIVAFNQYKMIQDSLFQKDRAAVVEELDEKYKVAEKQREIAFLKADRIEKELAYEKNQTWMMLVVSISILMTFILLFLYYRSKIKKKRIAQDLHIESLEKRELESLLIIKENEITKNIGLISEKSKLIQVLREASNKTNSNVDDIIQKFDQNYISDKEWGKIQIQFNSLHNDLIDKIQMEAGRLTQNDIKLIILLKLQYSNASMSEILNISYEGVKKAKQRLSKKVDVKLFPV